MEVAQSGHYSHTAAPPLNRRVQLRYPAQAPAVAIHGPAGSPCGAIHGAASDRNFAVLTSPTARKRPIAVRHSPIPTSEARLQKVVAGFLHSTGLL